MLLQKIKPNIANGPDIVPAKFIKETVIECGAMSHHLFCQLYQLGTLPSNCNHAPVCPIYKKGKKSEPVNYRTVSLTAFPCQIMEHCVVSSILSLLNKHNIITSKQRGIEKQRMIGLTYLTMEKARWTSIFVNVPSFRLSRGVIHYTIFVNTLESVDDHEYLGVIISHNLHWEKHCHNITKKANKTLGLLCHTLFHVLK